MKKNRTHAGVQNQASVSRGSRGLDVLSTRSVVHEVTCSVAGAGCLCNMVSEGHCVCTCPSEATALRVVKTSQIEAASVYVVVSKRNKMIGTVMWLIVQ